jgi:putative aldouronate transport system substrate-binding protein
MSDLLAISEAFTTKDPDGNGKADTFGLALDKDLNNINGFLNGFHAYKGIWIKDKDGKLAYSSIQPEMKTALGKMQEMFKNGQFDREFGVKDAPKVNESFGSGKIGMLYGSIGSANAPLSAQTPKTVWVPYPAPSIDSNPALLQHPLNLFNNGIWVVKKGSTRPEAVLKITELWLKFFYENTSDDIYKQYNYDLDTKISNWMNAPVKIYKTFKNAQISTHLEPLLKSDKPAAAADLAKLTPEEREVYQNIQKFKNGDVEQWYNNARSGLGGSGEIVNNYVKNNQFKPDLFITIPTPAMVQKDANLKKMELETFTKIILGASLDTFDQFVTDWKKLGGEDITKEVNEWYKSK